MPRPVLSFLPAIYNDKFIRSCPFHVEIWVEIVVPFLWRCAFYGAVDARLDECVAKDNLCSLEYVEVAL